MRGSTVYMIMYNYCEYDYSVVKIVASKEDALTYIRWQYEPDEIKPLEFKLVDINEKIDDNFFNICCFKQTEYYNYSMCDKNNVSSYIIVPMTVW